MKWFLALLLIANCAGTALADPVETSGEVEFWYYEYPIKGTMKVPGIDLDIDVELPPGYYFSEGAYNTLDAEVKRLQDAETRLGAENESLRKSAESGSWKGYAITFGLGIVAGAVGVWAL
jgi:hypothetical protein